MPSLAWCRSCPPGTPTAPRAAPPAYADEAYNVSFTTRKVKVPLTRNPEPGERRRGGSGGEGSDGRDACEAAIAWKLVSGRHRPLLERGGDGRDASQLLMYGPKKL